MTENEKKKQKLINSLTNWQRNQWARAGYSKDLAIIEAIKETKKK